MSRTNRLCVEILVENTFLEFREENQQEALVMRRTQSLPLLQVLRAYSDCLEIGSLLVLS